MTNCTVFIESTTNMYSISKQFVLKLFERQRTKQNCKEIKWNSFYISLAYDIFCYSRPFLVIIPIFTCQQTSKRFQSDIFEAFHLFSSI